MSTPWKHYDSLAELKAMVVAPKSAVKINCSRCARQRDMTISFVEAPPNPSLDAVTQLASVVDGSAVVVSLACAVCGPYPATRRVDLQLIFELHNLWSPEAIPEVLMCYASEILVNAGVA